MPKLNQKLVDDLLAAWSDLDPCEDTSSDVNFSVGRGLSVVSHLQDFIKVPVSDSDDDCKEDTQDQDEDDKDGFNKKMEQLKVNEHVLGPILACKSCLPFRCLCCVLLLVSTCVKKSSEGFAMLRTQGFRVQPRPPGGSPEAEEPEGLWRTPTCASLCVEGTSSVCDPACQEDQERVDPPHEPAEGGDSSPDLRHSWHYGNTNQICVCIILGVRFSGYSSRVHAYNT